MGSMRGYRGRGGPRLTPLIVIAALLFFGALQPLLAQPLIIVSLAIIVAATLLLRPLVNGQGMRLPRADRAMEGRMVALEESIKLLERQQRELQETVSWQARLLQETTPKPVGSRTTPTAE